MGNLTAPSNEELARKPIPGCGSGPFVALSPVCVFRLPPPAHGNDACMVTDRLTRRDLVAAYDAGLPGRTEMAGAARWDRSGPLL